MTEVLSRTFAMPSPFTFSIKPIKELLSRYLTPSMVIVDPFCGKAMWATYRNDIRTHKIDARDWLKTLNVQADAVLLDPPYSPRQMQESYAGAGLIKKGCEHTQNAKLYSETIVELDRLLVTGGIAIRCGWNALGFPKQRYTRLETLVVDHGGAHNATIVTVDRKL